MSEKLLQKIVDNFHQATILHGELASAMWFIGLQGYAYLHELQYAEEHVALRKVKNYIIKTYGIYLPDNIPASANLAVPLLGDKNRRELSQDETVKILKEAWRVYERWEIDTLKLYSGIAVELFDDKDVAAHNLVSDIVNEVKHELDNIVDIVMELDAHGWDMPQVVADQQSLAEEYKEKLNELRLGDGLV